MFISGEENNDRKIKTTLSHVAESISSETVQKVQLVSESAFVNESVIIPTALSIGQGLNKQSLK